MLFFQRTAAGLLAAFAIATACEPLRADQDVAVKRGRLKKLTTHLDGKKILWRALGDFDLVEDSSGKHATFCAPKQEPGQPSPPNEYHVLVISAKADQPLVEIINVKIEGEKPIPPEPGPGPGPNPKPDPPPDDAAKNLWVLIVEETATAGASRSDFLRSQEFRDLLAKGVKFRIVDKDVVDKSGQRPADLAVYFNSIAANGTPLPAIFVVDEKSQIRLFRGINRGETPAALKADIERAAKWR